MVLPSISFDLPVDSNAQSMCCNFLGDVVLVQKSSNGDDLDIVVGAYSRKVTIE
jgi:hypothetical protein